MRRLVPVRTSRDIIAFDEDNRPSEIVVRIEYEMKDVTDGEYEQLMSLHEAMLQDLPLPRK